MRPTSADVGSKAPKVSPLLLPAPLVFIHLSHYRPHYKRESSRAVRYLSLPSAPDRSKIRLSMSPIATSHENYDEEQLKLMEERLIVVDQDDNAIGEESKKTCKST